MANAGAPTIRTPWQLAYDAVRGTPSNFREPYIKDLTAATAYNIIWAKMAKKVLRLKLHNLGVKPIYWLANGDSYFDALGAPIVNPQDPNAVPTPRCSNSNFHDILAAGLVTDDGTGAQVEFDGAALKTLSVYALDTARLSIIIVYGTETGL